MFVGLPATENTGLQILVCLEQERRLDRQAGTQSRETKRGGAHTQRAVT